MTILVTGATGFIGRHVCATLTSQQHHVVALLRDPTTQLPTLKQQIRQLGGDEHALSAVKGDLDETSLGLQGPLPALSAIVHLGARFAWQLAMAEARRTNVAGSLAVAELARQQQCRLVFISGFMLENHTHLARLGIDTQPGGKTEWPSVYTRAGGYEASKLEAAIRVREFARQHPLDMVEIQPATVSGHSQRGELDPQQPLYQLIANLHAGRLAMIPGSQRHWLPLVCVDGLAELIALACVDPQAPARLLALDPNTPSLGGLLQHCAAALGRKPPRHYMPIPLLRGLLRLPGLPRLMNTWPEALHFIQTTRFDTRASSDYMKQHGLVHPDTDEVLTLCVQHFLCCTQREH